MLPLLLDENFNGRIYRGLKRVTDDINAIRVQDTELVGQEDPVVLEWAANHKRVLVTHDVNTIPAFAYDRMADGENMSGVIVVPEDMPIGDVIEELEIVIFCTSLEEFLGKVEYLPL